ncbi:MAG TPA: type II toxin-antitoxin system RelE/ParE family toxin [Tepidisphaeraceae bacterium]|jgi:mRNA interferase RelE/StbE|nr:type II toxin-antitoxin system RelE/ParE family toxin [Tepidisphaeraceae bacterium]
MLYTIEFRPKALRDIKRLAPDVSRRIEDKLELLCQDMAGDVKRLTNYVPGWRLRVGDWRVLFQPQGSRLIVHRIVHRSEAYE